MSDMAFSKAFLRRFYSDRAKHPTRNGVVLDSGKFVGFAEELHKALGGGGQLVAEPYRIEPEPVRCTCGVHATGGLHSDWCDLAGPQEDD